MTRQLKGLQPRIVRAARVLVSPPSIYIAVAVS
jgi:hypothetical protein